MQEKQLQLFDSPLNQQTAKDAGIVWNNFLEIISQSISGIKYNTWFKPVKAISFSGNILTISVPSNDFYKILTARFSEQINKALKHISEEPVVLNPVISNVIPDSVPHEHVSAEKLADNLPVVKTTFSLPEQVIKEQSPSWATNLNQDLTFVSFVRSQNNEFAVAAALSVASRPGHRYNPLLIYGGVGLGKTHLMQAVGNELVKNRPSARLCYITGPDFTTSFVQSIRLNNTHLFEKFYRSLDILIVDDIQFLEGKESTQNSFFQIFNSLYQLKKQIVLSCDKPPHQLTGLEERLITRFQWGLTVDIQPPDLETRIAILNKKCEFEQVEIPYEILEFVAVNIKDNIRSLEGCLKSMIFESQISGCEINMEIAKRSISKYGALKSRKLNVDIGTIISSVSRFFGIEESLLRLKTKRQEIVTARHVAMFLSKELTGCSLQTIGSHFGGRNHATVIHACKCVEDLINSDPVFTGKIDSLKEEILTS
jgi:chromosomal replication initiator protein